MDQQQGEGSSNQPEQQQQCTSETSVTPKPIKFDCIVVDVACHPNRDIIAAADIDGLLSIYSYSEKQENHELMTFNHHKKACRAVRFDTDGSRLVSVSKDKSIQVVDMQTGAVKQAIKKAHKSPLYSLFVVDQNIIATGDDDGYLKVWDLRHQSAVMDVHENEEFISDMYVEPSKRTLIATSGEGTLTAYDIRRHKMKLQSEYLDSGLLSMAIVKNGEKVVCGSEEGVLNIFNWDEWGNISDRFPGHPISVESIVPVTDSIVCTGAFDGIIRAVSILPNRFIGVVGDHDDFPIENMSITRDGRFLVSCAHDQKVKFWDLSKVAEEKVDAQSKPKKSAAAKPLSSGAARNDFFADMNEASEGQQKKPDGDESDDCDSDDNSDNDSELDNDDDSDNDDNNDSNENEGSEVENDENDDNNNSSDDDSDSEIDDDDEDSDDNKTGKKVVNGSNINKGKSSKGSKR